jgi:hypothetical protein
MTAEPDENNRSSRMMPAVSASRRTPSNSILSRCSKSSAPLRAEAVVKGLKRQIVEI